MKEIKLVGIDAEGVTEPRNDGTQGSALYDVPITLSETPTLEWGKFFEQAWGLPRNASVINNRIVVQRTTIEQVGSHEKARLQAAVKEANEKAQEFWAEQQRLKDDKHKQSREFRDHIRKVSETIKFD